jgi:hypothetical protein
MARKKHLLEVLLEASQATGPPSRSAPKPPKPAKPPRERRLRRALRWRPGWRGTWRVSLPAQAGAFVVLGLGAALLILNSIGLFRSRGGDATEISTKAADPHLELAADPVSEAPAPSPPVAEVPREWGVRVITYPNRKEKESIAIEAASYLTRQGIPDVAPFADVVDPQGESLVVVYAGAFPSKNDPGLQDLLKRIRALPGPGGKNDKPFESALIERLPRTSAPR